MDKMMNWAIFGAIVVIWTVGFRWIMEDNSGGDHVGFMFVTIMTVSMMAGKTEGSNGLEHVINGFKNCVNSLIGWAIASIIYMIIYQFTMGDGFNVQGLITHLVMVEVAYLCSMVMASAFNGVRE